MVTDIAEYKFDHYKLTGHYEGMKAARADLEKATATPGKPWSAAKDAETQAKPQEKQEEYTR